MAMAIDGAMVRRIARAAHLELAAHEEERFVRELSDILRTFATLDEAPLKGIEPSFQPFDVRDVVEEDKPEQCLAQQEALANTAHTEKGYFKGPRAV